MGEGYSWVPPGLSPARVEAYMRQLPADRVPRLGGSHGERWVQYSTVQYSTVHRDNAA